MTVSLCQTTTATTAYSVDQTNAGKAATKFIHGLEGRSSILIKLFERAGIDRRGSVVLNSEKINPVDQSFFPPAEDPADKGPTTAQRMEIYRRMAPELAIGAAEKIIDCVEQADCVTDLVTASCTGFFAPGIDIQLIQKLRLSPTVRRTHIGFMGCHAAINALRIARSLVRDNPDAVVLVVTVELCTLHFQYGWNAQRVVANSLFADGAAAMLVADPDRHPHLRDDTAWPLADTGCRLFPDSTEMMSWEIEDHGFAMGLSTKVPHLIQQNLKQWIDQWLAGQGLSLPEIRSWAIHPGGPRILQAVGEALNLTDEQLRPSLEVFQNHGNMSSPTVVFILDQLRSQQAALPCVALAFGPGLVAEAALFA